jgi:hypothetical protein
MMISMRAIGVAIGAAMLALASRTAVAWDSGALANPAGPPTCMAWQTLPAGTMLSFNFKPSGFVMRLTNPGWDLPRDAVYPATIVGTSVYDETRPLAAGSFKAETPRVLAAEFDYHAAPGLVRAIMETLLLDIQFPAYRYHADLSGLYGALERLTPCVASETGGYDPFH